MHDYHHPDRVRPDHEWVDWFTRFKDDNPDQTVGLEFVEGKWTPKHLNSYRGYFTECTNLDSSFVTLYVDMLTRRFT